MRVYLLSEGNYSDYHVVGAFSSREVAEAARKVWGLTNAVEWIELDPAVKQVPDGMAPYCVEILRDGYVLEVCAGEPWKVGRVELEGRAGKFTVLARDEKHAIKITNEKRGQLIRSDPVIDAGFRGWLYGLPVYTSDPALFHWPETEKEGTDE